jgi:uncharacterized protein YggU (UPF0235/DUF167 family)
VNSLRLPVKVSPKASRNRIQGWLGDTLKVAVTAAPERGKANAAVEALLAEALDLPARAVQVVAGHTQARKWVQVEGLDAAGVRARLGVG